MTPNKLAKVCAFSLGVFFLCGLPSCTIQKAISVEMRANYSHLQIISELAKADIVYLGETHDSLQDHQAQLEIISTLSQKNPRIAIALEMFQRPYQPVLDRYLAGEISETELREQTEYDRRWGFDWKNYAPILGFAKTHNIKLLALNTPTEVTRKVASEGLESLTEEEFRYIPPISEIRTDNEDYRQMLREVYEIHAHGGHGNSEGFEKFFTSQVLWDETMAQTIAQFYKANPDYQIIVLAGQGHIIYGYGIPERVARRLEDNSFIQRSVLMGNTPEFEFRGKESPADYFWKHNR